MTPIGYAATFTNSKVVSLSTAGTIYGVPLYDVRSIKNTDGSVTSFYKSGYSSYFSLTDGGIEVHSTGMYLITGQLTFSISKPDTVLGNIRGSASLYSNYGEELVVSNQFATFSGSTQTTYLTVPIPPIILHLYDGNITYLKGQINNATGKCEAKTSTYLTIMRIAN